MSDPIADLGKVQATQANRYTFVARLATGGQAEIYLARLEGAGGFHKPVVIKRLLPRLTADPLYRERLRAEAHLVAQLHHPNVCHVIDVVEGSSECFVVFEYLEGVTYADVISAMPAPRGAQDIRLVVTMLQQAAEGLQAAHDLEGEDHRCAGLVHRDVSSRNVLISVNGMVKVLDFGVAQTGDSRGGGTMLCGTAPYMSPEQVAGQPLDRRSDIFSLGTLAYEGLSGRSPFRRANREQTLDAVVRFPPPGFGQFQPALPPALEEVVATAMGKQPKDRYAQARDFGEALCAAIAPLGGSLTLAETGKVIRARFGAALEARAAQITALSSAAPSLAGAKRSSRELSRTVVSLDMQRLIEEPSISTLPALTTILTSSVPSGSPVEGTAVVPVSDDSPARARGGRWWTVVVAVIIAATATAAVVTKLRPGERVEARSTVPTAAVSPAGRPDAAVVPVPAVEPATDASVPDAAAADSPPERSRNRDGDRTASRKSKGPRAAKGSGYLTLDVTPHFARVFIDGKFEATTPLFKHPVRAGRHTVRLVGPEGRVKVFTIDVVAGREAPRRLVRWDP